MGKFMIHKSETGLTFHLKAVNGEIIGTSEVYNSKEACMKGIESVKHNVVSAAVEDQTGAEFEEQKCPKFQVYTDRGGEKIRFRLLARNGQEILASQAYKAKRSCMEGIKSVITNAPDAEIIEEKE